MRRADPSRLESFGLRRSIMRRPLLPLVVDFAVSLFTWSSGFDGCQKGGTACL